MQAFGYTIETMQFMLLPLVRELRDPVGSMGNDSAWRVSRDQPRMLYDYFKQLFAQVTNPPIDSIREEVIMSLECYIGPERNLLETTEQHAHRLRVPHPILIERRAGGAQAHRIIAAGRRKTIDITWPRSEGHGGPAEALDRICAEAEAAIDDGYSLVVLSDRAVGRDRVPLSSLLATGAVHHHLVRKAKRTRIGIVVEIGRSPRSASPLPARRLRRRCDQSVSGVRGAVASAREGLLQRPRDRTNRSQRRRQGHPAIEAGANGEEYDPVTKEDHELVPRTARASPRACSK